MNEFLNLYGYNLENKENILYILKKDNKELERDYKDGFWPFIDQDTKIIIGRRDDEYAKIIKPKETISYKQEDNITRYTISCYQKDINSKIKLGLVIKQNKNIDNNLYQIEITNILLDNKPYTYRNVIIESNIKETKVYVNNKLVIKYDKIILLDELFHLLDLYISLDNSKNIINNYNIIRKHILFNIENIYLNIINNKEKYINNIIKEKESINTKYEEKLKKLNDNHEKELHELDDKLIKVKKISLK